MNYFKSKNGRVIGKQRELLAGEAASTKEEFDKQQPRAVEFKIINPVPKEVRADN